MAKEINETTAIKQFSATNIVEFMKNNTSIGKMPSKLMRAQVFRAIMFISYFAQGNNNRKKRATLATKKKRAYVKVIVLLRRNISESNMENTW